MSGVLVTVNDDDLRSSLLPMLRAAGINATAPTGRRGPAVVVREAPGSTALIAAELRQLAAAWRIEPALVLVASEDCAYSRAEALLAGADELVAWPNDQQEFVPKVSALLRRREADIDAHPLTGLPGGAALNKTLSDRLPRRGELAVLAFDMRHFKAFNDQYGFSRGDEALNFLADMLEQVAHSGEMVYHVGGDDFFVVTTPERADEFARQAIEKFDAQIPDLYDPADRSRGFILGLSRGTGLQTRFPILTVTVACATNEAQDMTHPGQLAQVLAELKQYAKRDPHSSYARDRRHIHDVAASLRARAEADRPPQAAREGPDCHTDPSATEAPGPLPAASYRED